MPTVFSRLFPMRSLRRRFVSSPAPPSLLPVAMLLLLFVVGNWASLSGRRLRFLLLTTELTRADAKMLGKNAYKMIFFY